MLNTNTELEKLKPNTQLKMGPSNPLPRKLDSADWVVPGPWTKSHESNGTTAGTSMRCSHHAGDRWQVEHINVRCAYEKDMYVICTCLKHPQATWMTYVIYVCMILPCMIPVRRSDLHLPEWRKLKKLDTTESRAAAALGEALYHMDPYGIWGSSLT